MIFVCALQLFSLKAIAQLSTIENVVSATASVRCTIVSPIGITKIRDMYFGKIISGNSGTVQLAAEGGLPVTSGNVALQTKNSIFSSAIFVINDGLNNSSSVRQVFKGFSITLPSKDVTLTNANGSTMTVSNFTSNTTPIGSGSSFNGTGYLSIGATLYVSSAQGLGQYASTTPFPVTVNFY